MADDEAERDGAGELQIVEPFEARMRQHRVAGIQAFRYAHSGNRHECERKRKGHGRSGAAAADPRQREAGRERHQHVSEVGLIAWSGDLSSQAAQVKVTWDGAPEVTRKLYALVIGVSNYADPAMTLKFAAKDAGDFAKALAAQNGRYYADVQTRVLTDREVTRASVIEGLQWLERMATNPNNVSVLFLAGHGMTDAKQTYWFYTSDSNDDTVLVNGVSQDELRKSLQGLQGKVLWFLDTCHAGTAAKRSPVDINVLVNTVSASENGGIVVFASSTGRQVSVESADLGNGAFTKAVVEGIALGKAALGDGVITTSTLDSYVVRRVEQFTGKEQTPVMERPPEEPDFTIAEMRKR